MRLMTKALAKKIPKLYSTEKIPVEDKIAVAKYFLPMSRWTWYVVEGEEAPDGDWLFFGYVEGLEKEWGYFHEPLFAERDLHFKPTKMADITRRND